MRKFLLLIAFCPGPVAWSQQPAANPFPKTITVTGSSEMEIIPDEVYVNVVLKEYQKKGEPKRNLEILKNNFLASCLQAGIPDSVISIASYGGHNNYWLLRKSKKTNPDLFATITYQVRFSASKQMDELVEKLDDEATQGFDIVYSSHSKMTEFRKQVKTHAIKAAKEKALYLTDAIQEKLGVAITVKEPDETAYGIRGQFYYSNEINRSVSEPPAGATVDFKKIKLRYEIHMVFALQ
jgi:uncharacterized protein